MYYKYIKIFNILKCYSMKPIQKLFSGIWFNFSGPGAAFETKIAIYTRSFRKNDIFKTPFFLELEAH